MVRKFPDRLRVLGEAWAAVTGGLLRGCRGRVGALENRPTGLTASIAGYACQTVGAVTRSSAVSALRAPAVPLRPALALVRPVGEQSDGGALRRRSQNLGRVVAGLAGVLGLLGIAVRTSEPPLRYALVALMVIVWLVAAVAFVRWWRVSSTRK
jgi:hypothetical protein